MTEKRYLLKWLEYEPYYIDTKQKYVDEAELRFELDGYKTMSDEQVVSLLNENEQLKHKLSQQEMECATTCYHLSEDYEKLKQEVRELEKVYVEEVFKIEDKFEEEILALEKENEQLKIKNNAYLQDIEVFKEENTILKLENERLKKDRFICLDCEHSGYTEIGCLCEYDDHWVEFMSECEDFKEVKE